MRLLPTMSVILKTIVFGSGVLLSFLLGKLIRIDEFTTQLNSCANSLSHNGGQNQDFATGKNRFRSSQNSPKLPLIYLGAFEHKFRRAFTKVDTMAVRRIQEKVTILCWILTYPKNKAAAEALKKTWGRRCTKLVFVTTKKDSWLGDVVYLNVTENRDNLWRKTWMALKHLYEYHLDDADWFMKADDDTYVYMENLRSFLSQYDPRDPLYFGFKYVKHVDQGYMSGGAGYVLSKEAVKRIYEVGFKEMNVAECGMYSPLAEDMCIGKYAEKSQVEAMDTRDVDHKPTFMVFTLSYAMDTYSVQHTPWYFEYAASNHSTGLDCCSRNLISTHYVKGNEMYRMEYLVYNLLALKREIYADDDNKLTRDY